ncbi:Heavy metal tolerance protein [Cyphellophora attinorum]|uniref:ABC multidrug transporter MDR2 n=1 Tax=Cyphellophora attinorum TaxID=1664694 RepID=A0A0N1H5R4_9EURO|nr:Heavy metal tolerance protein [Phialophora attinorum]KPI41155.1 Heavy metal tolerance protein [Phialophora attinorum]
MYAYSESTLNSFILLYYLITSIVALIRRPKDRKGLGIRSQRFLLSTTCVTVATCLVVSIVDAIVVSRRDTVFMVRETDDGLFGSLVQLLLWLIVLLVHTEHPGVVSYPEYGVWILTCASRLIAPVRLAKNASRSPVSFGFLGAQLSLRVSSDQSSLSLAAVSPPPLVSLSLSSDQPLPSIELLATVLRAVHVGLCLVLVLVWAILQILAKGKAAAGTDEETQPLLATNDTEADKDAEGDEEEEESGSGRESPEEKRAREELHNRPVSEYLRSFSVYLPIIWPASRAQKLYCIGMLLCMICLRVVAVLMPLALAWIIDTLVKQNAPWLPILGYFVLYFLDSRVGIGLLAEYLHLLTSNYQKLNLCRAAYNHVMDLSADFQDSKTSSEIWQAMSQAQSVIDLFYGACFQITPMLIDLVTGFIMIWKFFGAYLGWLVMTLAVLMVYISLKSLRTRVTLTRKWRDSWYDSYHQMVDSTQNWYTAAQFSRIPYEKETFSSKRTMVVEGRNKVVYFYYRTTAERFILLTLAYLLAMALAGLAIYQGELGAGYFAALTGYWGMVTSPVMYIVAEITEIADKLIDAEKLLVLLEKRPTIVEAEDAQPFNYLGGQVEFENVFFTYDGKKTAADGINFQSNPKTMTAFVGETGGGKSTILKLLMRFYDPEKGRVLIDGQDVRNLQLDSLRKHIAVVPQEISMFHTTVLENVRYGDPSISEAEVEEACKAVALHDKILSFAKGYQSQVGERGCQLSGGEKQRLAIARAMLKKPNILLLDEATSSVDSITEGQIQTSLDRVCKDRSTFVIAHRLSTILKADQILVIEGGKIIEAGTHAQLIKNRSGAYHKMWQSQAELQGEMSRSRSRSKTRVKLRGDGSHSRSPSKPSHGEDSAEAGAPTLIDDVGDAGDVASLTSEVDSPEESIVQTPNDQASADGHSKPLGES